MALPRVAVGWSSVCDCGIFLIILTYFLYKKNKISSNSKLKRHCYFSEINSGVMLFNLTRMRASNFNESIHQYRKQYGNLLSRGDQAILSIYRLNYPGESLKDCIESVLSKSTE